ncbi:hypothetical protein [Streptomyces hebeiensis]
MDRIRASSVLAAPTPATSATVHERCDVCRLAPCRCEADLRTLVRTAATRPLEALDSAAVSVILRAVANRLDALNPHTRITRGPLRTEVQLSVWDWHGTYSNAVVGRDITTVLAAIVDLPLTGTRADYAQALRTHLGAVTV